MPSTAEQREEDLPETRELAAAVGAIAATYGYFLLFAQFGFLRAVQAPASGAAGGLRVIMAVMGAGGIAGSVLAARRFTTQRSIPQLAGSFAACALAAALSIFARNSGAFAGVAALVGLGTGMATVTLASMLRRVVGAEKLGTCAGLGTGLAYAFCNLPPVFTATPRGQAVIGGMIAIAGIVAAQGLKPRAPSQSTSVADYTPTGVRVWVTVLFALVWLDSAAFSIIQHTPVLKGDTWTGNQQLSVNARVHFVAALFAGYALDRRRVGSITLAAALLLLAACLLLDEQHRTFAVGALFYTAGVSFYSTVLLFYPARAARPGLAALTYSVAGWGGSALGIGMAQNLGRVPGWFVAVAGTTILGALLLRWKYLRGKKGAVAAGLLALGWPGREAHAAAPADIALGRRVFIGEGCLHCHSQYVRSGTADELRWGPARPLGDTRADQPPLLGNRRQGPDLQNVASRRLREWNRAHLADPCAITPGSRMPSYAQLFAGDGARGEALLAYLDSLGGAAMVERAEAAQRWQPAPTGAPARHERAAPVVRAMVCGLSRIGGARRRGSCGGVREPTARSRARSLALRASRRRCGGGAARAGAHREIRRARHGDGRPRIPRR